MAFDEAQFVRYRGMVMPYKKAKARGIPDAELAESGLHCTACGEFRRGVAYMGCRCDRLAYESGRDWQEYRHDNHGP